MNYSRPWMFSGLALMALGAFLLWQQSPRPTVLAAPPKATPRSDEKPVKKSSPEAATKAAAAYQWKDLFDGRSLKGWKSADFGGDGKVYVKDGAIVMDIGRLMTGIKWTGDVLRSNYELTLEGMRLDGSDFFCTTTFPVGKDPCTLVVGGWGGQVVGLSNVDFQDASENITTTSMEFKDNRWYKVRIRVSDAAIEAWIDGKKMVNQPREDHKFTIRMEVEECRPLGIATWSTKGAVRNIQVRELKPEEVKDIAARVKAGNDDK